MKEEDIDILAQFLSALSDGVTQLEIAQKSENREAVMRIKRDLLALHKKIAELI